MITPKTPVDVLMALVDRYWELAYAEGKEGRDHDTEAGEAQAVLSEIRASARALAAIPAPAKQREMAAGLERCEFDDECSYCQSPQGGSFTRLAHNAEDCTEAEFYICGDCAYKAIDAFRTAPTPPTAPAQDAQGVEELIAFLNGSAPLDGVWFGEKHPTERGMFWWRKRLTALRASSPADTREPLTDEQIEALRDATFSINNPFCPVDSKSMRKAVRAAERAHGIKEST